MNTYQPKSRVSILTRCLRSRTVVLIIFLIVLAAVFGAMTDGKFVTLNNFRAILQTISVIGLLAIGAGILMIAGYVDLSVGGVGSVCAMACAMLVKNGTPWWIALIAAIALGALCGLVNAVLITKLNFEPFIATLAMAQIGQGFLQILSDAQYVKLESPVLNSIGGARLFGYFPYTSVFVIMVFIIYSLLMSKTQFGRRVYFIGANPEAARLSGVDPKKNVTALYINSGIFAALAGIINMMRVGSATLVGITVNQFSGMTAAVIGGISFGGGTGGVAGAFVGLLILGSFNNAMTMLGLNAYLQSTASGLLLLIALSIDYFVVTREKRSALKATLAA